MTPDKTQGAVVGDDFFAFSRSEGRTRVSLLTTTPKEEIATGDPWHDPAVIDEWVTINMSEGITWAPFSATDPTSNLYVVFESGSAAYGPNDDGGPATCRTHRIYQRIRTDIV